MDVFPIDWQARDVQGQYVITMFGKTEDGTEVAVNIAYFPYFYIEAPRSSGGSAAKTNFLTQTAASVGAVREYTQMATKVTMWGFTNSKSIDVVRLAFKSYTKRKIEAQKFTRSGKRVYESGIDPLMRFFHGRNVAPSQWVRVSKYANVADADRQTRCVKEVSAKFYDVGPSALRTRPPLVIASWDGEMYSAARLFPKGSNPEDPIIQLAITFQRYGEDCPYRQTVMCLRDTAEVPGVDIHVFDDEHELINAFIEELGNERVDVLIGYNTDQFDWPYVASRSLLLADDDTGEPLVNLTRLGKMREGGGEVIKKDLNSAAYGNNQTTYITTPGMLQVDLLTFMRKEYKLESYSLNNVSEHFLQDKKLDVPAGEIFEKFDKGTAKDRAVIAEYAVKDTELPMRLLTKLCILETLMEMASATFVPVDFVVRRGQQIKVFSVLMRKAMQLGYVSPDGVSLSPEGTFKGATVLDAMCGAYFDIVSCLDFASLYPSIIRGWNLDYTSMVMDPKFDNIPGVDYNEIVTDQGTFRFAKTTNAVMPALLSDLAAYRAGAKAKMKAATTRGDTFAAALHNAEQLAFKVTMNSAYGFLGAANGMMACAPIAACVTATGRAMIMETKRQVEELHPGSVVVYGDTDSVMVILELGKDCTHDMHAHFDAAQKVAAIISEAFPNPVELEFEKCYWPFVLYSKKRYAGLMYTDPTKDGRKDVKGLEVVRRDACPFVKGVCNAILDNILFDRSATKALLTARTSVLRLLRGQEPVDSFVVSRQLKSANDYKHQESQPHVAVARKKLQRTGEMIPSGVRVPFVYVFSKDSKKSDLLAQRAEDPEHVKKHGLHLDTIHYFEGMRKPIETLLAPLTPDAHDQVFAHSDVLALVRSVTNARTHQLEITSFFGAPPPKKYRDTL